ncbi:MAG: NAD(P)/FAD-dependent oxidoreductase [Steroidobacteraceae bacterium]
MDIVGAGPAGLVLALLLARRGRSVRVFERRPDPRRAHPEGGRSINLALAARGMRVLRAADALDALREFCVPMPGRMLHVDGNQQFIAYGQRADETLYSISRATLHEQLTRSAATVVNIELNFGQRCLGLQSCNAGLLRMRDEVSGREYELRSEFIIGADGAGSALRDGLCAAGALQVREERLAHGYQEFTIPAQDGRHVWPPQALHIWPRGSFMLIALPNNDGSFTATLFLPEQGRDSFASLAAEPHALRALFEREFPDASALMPQLEAEALAHPPSSLGTVYCEPWQAPGRVLLLGDAAHAIVPFHGQGMNCALEDCLLFDELLGTGNDFAAAAAQFEERRRPDTDAIAQMALENYLEMRDSVRDPLWQRRKALALELEQRFPARFIPRYSMVMFHAEIGYADALRRGAVQQAILEELTTGDAIDWTRAARLVTERLAPVSAPAY